MARGDSSASSDRVPSPSQTAKKKWPIGVGRRSSAVCNVQVLLYRFNTCRSACRHSRWHFISSAADINRIRTSKNKGSASGRGLCTAPQQLEPYGSVNPCEGGCTDKGCR